MGKERLATSSNAKERLATGILIAVGQGRNYRAGSRHVGIRAVPAGVTSTTACAPSSTTGAQGLSIAAVRICPGTHEESTLVPCFRRIVYEGSAAMPGLRFDAQGGYCIAERISDTHARICVRCPALGMGGAPAAPNTYLRKTPNRRSALGPF